MEANEWQSVLRRASEDINLSLALRQSCRAANDEIERLRKERDEARRRVCEDAIKHGRVYRRVGRDTVRCETSSEVAEMMGWDCFKEDADER